ncbi:MAG: VWA domain-containing protein [Myxococcales bacterium]|jgi:hypothetical protein|nr:VWA domain-containing protein [Myxococcales bacterium]
MKRVLGVAGFLGAMGMVTALASGCGTAGESEFPVPPDPGAKNGNNGGDGSSGATFGTGNTNSENVNPNSSSSGSSGETCAATSSKAKLTPVNMVVVVDRSGSMGDTTEDPSFDPALRWVPVTSALKSFFSDPASTGMRANLTYFPDATNSCTTANYSSASVPLTDLPSGAFATSIDATSPKGDTPTRAALGGAIAQAQAVRASHPGEKTVIVFATDGEPYGCGVEGANLYAKQVQAVKDSAADVAAVAADIPTYVIGVGPSVTLLNDVAVAGGTAPYLAVSVGSPAKTTADLLAAMTAIRGQLASCTFAIPKPADGRPIDYNKVKVELKKAGEPTQTLLYSADCANPDGWRYDNTAAPTQVELCKPGACDKAQTRDVEVSFVCVDQQKVVPIK